MNQSEYLNLSRKRKRTTKQIDEEREKSLEKNTIYAGALDRGTRKWISGTKENKLGPSRLSPTKRPETIRDRIANKLDEEGHGSSGDFHKSGTKNIKREDASPYRPKSMKHKGRSR